MNNPCDIQGSQEEADAVANQWSEHMQTLGNDLVHGNLSLDEFHSQMQDDIRTAYIQEALAGTERPLTPADLSRVQDAILEQYQFLDRFMNDIMREMVIPGASLEFIPGRAAMYARSAETQYWHQATNVDLPVMPGEGCQCLSNCLCSWRLECPQPGIVEAYWELGATDRHCPDCLSRSEQWNPLVIEVG